MSIWLDESGDGTSRLVPARISRGPRTGFTENFGAAWQATGKVDLTVSRAGNLRDAYAPIVEALNRDWRAEGRRPLVNPYGISEGDPLWGDAVRMRRPEEELVSTVWAEIERRRATDPGALAGAPKTRQELEDRVHADALAVVDEAAGVHARGVGMGATAGAFTGGMARAMTDPPNLLSMLVGAPASWGILRTAATEGAINMGVEAALQPAIASYRRELGLGYTTEDFLRNVGFAGAGGFLLAGAIKGGVTVGGRVLEARRLRRADLIERIRKMDSPTAEQRGALHGAARELDLDRAIPIEDPPAAARGEHRERLNQAMAAVDDGRIPDMPDRPGNEGIPPARLGEADNLDGVIHAFEPAELKVDADTFQFKTGADTAGLTDRLGGVARWDPVKAGHVVVYEYRDGGRFIADGHQRLALARRLGAQGQEVRLYGHLLREADGISSAEARVIAAAKNIAEGTGSAVDAAKILRVDPARLGELPPNSALVRHARDMANLSDDAFMMAVNQVVPEHFAALVGRLAEARPELHAQILAILKKAEPENAAQAESIVREVLGAGTVTQRQVSLFGEADETVSLYADRARVLDRALKQLRRDRAVFNTLVGEAGRIEAAGNRLAADTNLARANTDGEAIETLTKLAHRKGPLSDALTGAAGRARGGDAAGAVAEFVGFVRRATDNGDLARMVDGAGGRGGEAAPQVRPGEPDLETRRLETFAEPAGAGQADQASAILTDLQRGELDALEVPIGERVDADGTVRPETRTAREILDDHAADDAFLDALDTICGPGGAA